MELHVDNVLDRFVVNSQQLVARAQTDGRGHAAWLNGDDTAAGEGGGVDFLEEGHLSVFSSQYSVISRSLKTDVQPALTQPSYFSFSDG